MREIVGKSKVLLGAALVAVLLASMVPAFSAVASPGTSVSISPSDQSVEVGDTFTVDVVIDSDEALTSADITLSWDAGKIDCTSISGGDFWGAEALRLPDPLDRNVDNGSGTTGYVGAALLTGSATGTGTHATYEFVINEGGDCTIEVEVASMVNDKGEEVAGGVTTTDGTVTSEGGDTPAPDEVDLVITQISTTWVDEDETYEVSYTVKNRGGADAGEFTVAVDIDGSTEETETINSLAAGSTKNGTVGPFSLSGSSDTVRVCADDGDHIDESDENNNCKETTRSVSGSVGGDGDDGRGSSSLWIVIVVVVVVAMAAAVLVTMMMRRRTAAQRVRAQRAQRAGKPRRR